MQTGKIKRIITPDRTYNTGDNVLIFAVESGTANQFIIDLQKNTIRGLDGKIRRGWLPCKAPQGYLNYCPSDLTKDKDVENIIIKDPNRFPLIRKIWDLLLTEQYTINQILDIANNQWGYRTKKTRKIGDRPLAKSSLYRIFHNPFYYGAILYRGKLYDGIHEPMITYQEFEAAKNIINKIFKPQPKTREFAYGGGILRCGHCGCSIVGEEKDKFVKTANEWRSYVYYRCTKKKPEINCANGRLTVKELEDQISECISSYEIDDSFLQWGLKILEREHQAEVENRNQRHEMLNNTYLGIQRQLDNLTQLRIKDMINDDQFNKDKIRLENEMINTRQQLNGNYDRGQQWIDIVDTAISFVGLAFEVFNSTDKLPLKRQILSSLGVNFVIKDKKLSIDPVLWLKPVQTLKKKMETPEVRFELLNFVLNKKKNEVNYLALPFRGGYRELNPK